MEHALNDKKPESSSDGVFQIPTEPAVVINGIPNSNAAPDCPARSDVRSDAESSVDHGLGEWLEGREVKKVFGEKYYSGKVMYFDRETNWYRVVYEDDDFEDMEWHELQEVLVPLDIAIPLNELSTKFLNHKRSVSRTAKTSAKSKSYHKANNKGRERLVSSDAARSNVTDGNQIKRKRGRPRLPEHMRKSNLKKGEKKSLNVNLNNVGETDGNQIKRKRGRPRLPEHMRKSNLKKGEKKALNVNQNSVGETTACQNDNVVPKAEALGNVDGGYAAGLNL